MSVDPVAQEAALPFRVYGLEQKSVTQDAAIARLDRNTAAASEAVAAQAVTLARHEEQLGVGHEAVGEVKTDLAVLAASVVTLGEKVAASSNKIAWTFAGFACTIAVSAIAIVLTGHPV